MSDMEVPVEPAFEHDSLLKPDFCRAPQPYYKRMRDTNPVLRTASLYGGTNSVVYLSRHHDVELALRNPAIFSNEYGLEQDPEGLAPRMIPQQVDPPEQLKYRRLLDPLFSPRQMNKLEANITHRANELIDGFIGRGKCDYAEEYAVPLPCGVFLQLMGLPTSEVPVFLEVKEKSIRGTPGASMSYAEDPVRKAGTIELLGRFEELIAERRRRPKEDLLTELLNADIDGRRLSHEELLGMCRLLFMAGLDTVTDSLTCFFAFLARNPDKRRRLVEDPEVIPSAVEEMLRYETPAPWVPRVAAGSTEVSGCPIEKGEEVILLIGAANTDERAFDRADVVDFDRQNIRHFAFGAGIHRCLGSHLARLELRVSLREWHRRIPQYHIPEGVELEWAPVMRQVTNLPLVFDTVVE